DLYRSSATEFIVEDGALLPPLNVVDGLGTNAAINVVKAREDGEFLSKEDLRERSRISKTVIEHLDAHGCLEGMEEKNQLSLFELLNLYIFPCYVILLLYDVENVTFILLLFNSNKNLSPLPLLRQGFYIEFYLIKE